MIADLDLFGVFLNSGLVAALLALALHIPVRIAFRWTNAWRWFWHPALVGVALFVILWGGVAFALQAFPIFASGLLG